MRTNHLSNQNDADKPRIWKPRRLLILSLRRNLSKLTCGFLLAVVPLSAGADVAKVLNQNVIPAMDSFALTAQNLADTASKDCRAEALGDPYQKVFDAWMGISYLSFGPLERDGRGLNIEFWPDPRSRVSNTVNKILAKEDPAVDDAATFASWSIAGRGLMALEQLVYDTEHRNYQPNEYACRYAKAVTADLAGIAKEVRADWQEHAQLLLTAADGQNRRYLSASEATQVLYTALLSAIEFNTDQRLGRPLGTRERPRPRLAEAHRSDRPLRNLMLSLTHLRDIAQNLVDQPVPLTLDAFDAAIKVAETIDDPAFSSVGSPDVRRKVALLQWQMRVVGEVIEAEIGTKLGLTAGFNSMDGD